MTACEEIRLCAVVVVCFTWLKQDCLESETKSSACVKKIGVLHFFKIRLMLLA